MGNPLVGPVLSLFGCEVHALCNQRDRAMLITAYRSLSKTTTSIIDTGNAQETTANRPGSLTDSSEPATTG